MSPQELFDLHVYKAYQVASKLCLFYAVSGSRNYREEAISEAKMALWRCCVEFDPNKQVMQIRQQQLDNKQKSEEIILACIFGYEAPPVPTEKNQDPYKNFWMLSLLRVRGSVIDFFRQQRLIIKPVITGELANFDKATIKKIKNRVGVDDDDDIALEYGISHRALEKLKPTMLYQERFLSLDRALDAACGEGESRKRDSFNDIIASNSRTDHGDKTRDSRNLITIIKSKAQLSEIEEKVIDYLYSEDGYSASDVAAIMHITSAKVKNLAREALNKMRGVAIPTLEISVDRVSV